MKSALILPDIHYPHHDKKCIDIITQVAQSLKPDYLVYLGDGINADGISKYTHKKMEKGIIEASKEIEGFVSEIHTQLSPHIKEQIFYTGGNHCFQRIEDLLNKLEEKDEEPEVIKFYEDLLSFKKRMPEVKFCKWNEAIKIGKLYFTHGTYHNDAHAKKHALAFGASVVYGHLHSVTAYTATSRSSGQSNRATSLGCLCNLNPTYLKNRPTGWSQGFGVVYFHDNGDFNLYPVDIIKGKCIFNGVLYS